MEVRVSNAIYALPSLRKASSRFAWLFTKKPAADLARLSAKRSAPGVARFALAPKKTDAAVTVKNKPLFLRNTGLPRATAANKVAAAAKKQSVVGLFASVFYADSSAAPAQTVVHTPKTPVRSVKAKPASAKGVAAVTTTKVSANPSHVRKSSAPAPKPHKRGGF